MKKYLFFVFFLIAQCHYAQETFDYKKAFTTIQKESTDSKSNFHYSKQLKKFLANDTLQTDNEMLHLLIGYTALKKHSSEKDALAANPLFKLNEKGKFQTAKVEAEKILQQNPFHIKVMIELNYSLTNLGKLKEAKAIQYRMYKIYRAMLYSCSGKPQEQPIFALAAEDATSFVQFFLREQIETKKTEKDKKGNIVETIRVKKNGQSLVYRFVQL